MDRLFPANQQCIILRSKKMSCKCTLGPGGKPCCLSLSIQRSRDKCAELSHNELDLVMAQIHSLRTVEHEVCDGKTSTFRPSCSYFIHGVKICRATFLFLHRISSNRYFRILSLYDAEGFVSSVHGNMG